MQLALTTSHARLPAQPNDSHFLPAWGEVFVAGDTALLDRPGIAVVGSRRSSPEGRRAAATIASELGRIGAVVVSGLAAGIDVVAHEAAMAAGGLTIAVIGTSLDTAYPREHASLQARIAREHLVVSPFECGTPTSAWHFPKRNRLMARISLATVLIEASATSGTRHQIGACATLGRPILAPADLVDELGWLQTASVRRHLYTWRNPSEALGILADHLAKG